MKTHFKNPTKGLILCVLDWAKLLQTLLHSTEDLNYRGSVITFISNSDKLSRIFLNVFSPFIWALGLRQLSFYLPTSKNIFEIKVYFPMNSESFMLSGTIGLTFLEMYPSLWKNFHLHSNSSLSGMVVRTTTISESPLAHTLCEFTLQVAITMGDILNIFSVHINLKILVG